MADDEAQALSQIHNVLRSKIISRYPTFDDLQNGSKQQRKFVVKQLKHFCLSDNVSINQLTTANADKFFNDHLQCLQKIYEKDKPLFCCIYKYNDGHPDGFQPERYGLTWKRKFAEIVTEEYPTAKVDVNTPSWHDDLNEFLKSKTIEIERYGIAPRQ